jgi:hypothetical protein
MKSGILNLALLLMISGCSRQPSGGTTAAETPRFYMVPGDVSSAKITLEAGWTVNPTQEIEVLHMQLSDSKAAQFREFTKRHINEMVEYMAAGKSVGQPVIRREITNGLVEIPFGFPNEARHVADSLKK